MRASPQGMRALLTADAVGGVWRYALGLAQALCARGMEIHLVTLGPAPDRAQRQAAGRIAGLTLEVTDLALEWADPAGEDIARAHAALARIAARVRPDLVHLNGYREAAYHWNAPVLVAAHSCVRSWWRACRGGDPDGERWRIYADNARGGLAAADDWVAPSAGFHATIRELYAPPRRGHVVHNGIALRGVRVAAKEPLVLAAGRLWDEAKNIALLASAGSRTGWRIAVAGPLEAGANSATWAQAEARNVAYLGALPHDDLLGWMARAAVFVSPALYEPFGLAALEAAAAGCALVLSDIPSFRELWSDAALLIDPRSETSLRDALDRLERDEALRRRLQAAAKRRAARYGIEAMAERYAVLYAALVSGSAQRNRAPRAELVEAAP